MNRIRVICAILVAASIGTFLFSETAPGKESLSFRIDQVRERASELYCSCNNIDGRELVFNLSVLNRTDQEVTGYLFIWVSNDEVSPAERGLWPLDAVESSLTAEGELAVRNPKAGSPVRVPAGQETVIKDVSLVEPIGFFKGERVRFREMKVELWSREGKLSSRTFSLLGFLHSLSN